MNKLLRIGTMLLAVAFGQLYGPAMANEAIPSAKAPIAAANPDLNADEYTFFRKAMRAASDDKWDMVRGYVAGIHNSAARDLLLWRLAIEDEDAGFFELRDAVEAYQEWPRHTKIRLEAEEKIAESGMNPAFIIEYFDAWPALSGDGKLAFAHALKANGFEPEAAAQIRSAWRNNPLNAAQEREIIARFGDLLQADDHMARADAMIWSRQRAASSRMIGRLSGVDKILVNARVRLMRNQAGIDAAVRKVPKAHAGDGGLVFERAYWRRRHGLSDEAIELALQFPSGSMNEKAANRMWTERHLLARRALKDGDFQTAYTLAAFHGFTKGGNFAAGEFLAGWLALQKLGDPILALSHFTRLKDGVSRPVSLARAYYWMGRAQENLSENEAAQMSWQKAARHDFTFYGQLAIQKLGGLSMDLGRDPVPSVEQRAVFEANRQIQALKLVGHTSNKRLFRTLSYHLDDLLPNAVDHVMLADLARDMGHQRASVRAAKAALWRGEILPDSAWPVIDLPPNLGVESAFLLALMRQETELDPQAISPVGAQGLMQLMPKTARQTARALGERYRKTWLTADPQYNIRLGVGHMEMLIDDYNGSYVLAIAAYNAGKTRANRWIKDYGDPRGEVDPIDWVESIPFSETRNYVMRVLENVQVYRHRLAQGPVPITIVNDLNRGSGS